VARGGGEWEEEEMGGEAVHGGRGGGKGAVVRDGRGAGKTGIMLGLCFWNFPANTVTEKYANEVGLRQLERHYLQLQVRARSQTSRLVSALSGQQTQHASRNLWHISTWQENSKAWRDINSNREQSSEIPITLQHYIHCSDLMSAETFWMQIGLTRTKHVQNLLFTAQRSPMAWTVN
jgi:hypothetical protein